MWFFRQPDPGNIILSRRGAPIGRSESIGIDRMGRKSGGVGHVRERSAREESVLRKDSKRTLATIGQPPQTKHEIRRLRAPKSAEGIVLSLFFLVGHRPGLLIQF